MAKIEKRRPEGLSTCVQDISLSSTPPEKSSPADNNAEGAQEQVKVVMDANTMARTVKRLAHEIEERNRGYPLALIGIVRRGVPLSERLRGLLQELGCAEIALGSLDISLYRDDEKKVDGDPRLIGRTIPFSIKDKTIVLVDDVLYTGRTVRAALQALADLGRPRAIQLAVLVDRGEHQLPIRADFVGANVVAGDNQRVYVRVAEIDGIDAVIVGPAQKPLTKFSGRVM